MRKLKTSPVNMNSLDKFTENDSSMEIFMIFNTVTKSINRSQINLYL